MGTGALHAKALSAAVGAAVLACLFCSPTSASDNVQVAPVYSDTRGNQAWVEFETAGERSKATPFVSVDEDGLKRLLENPDENGSLALPVPRLMRLVERARQAIRAMKRPTANAPARPNAPAATAAGAAGPNGAVAAAAAPTDAAAPGGDPPETLPERTGSSARPGETDTKIPLPAEAYNTVTR